MDFTRAQVAVVFRSHLRYCNSHCNLTLSSTSNLFPTGYTITFGGSIKFANLRLIDDENLSIESDSLYCAYEEPRKQKLTKPTKT